MKYLKGRPEEDIMDDFRKKYNIQNEHEWYQMVKYIRRPKLGKHFVLVWGLSLVLLGVCFTITVLMSLGEDTTIKVPLIFTEVNGFLERFINVIQVTFMIVTGLALVILPWFRISKVYKWDE